jgi:hypothetical protein
LQKKSKISELKSNVAEQQKEVETPIARVQEQAEQISESELLRSISTDLRPKPL